MSFFPSTWHAPSRSVLLSTLGLICLFLNISCGPPQVAPTNLRLTASLRTALSARSSDWLQQNVNLIEERRRDGQMADAEYEFFQQIITLARDGRWEEAEREAVRLQKAQRPTTEQVRRNAYGEVPADSATHTH